MTGPSARVTFVALALSLGGCGLAFRVTPLGSPQRALVPRSPASVDVYAGVRPRVPARDLALLVVEQESIYSLVGEDAALARMREEAARMGCDAIVILGASGTVGNGIDGRGARTLAGFRASCIQYETEAPPASGVTQAP